MPAFNSTLSRCDTGLLVSRLRAWWAVVADVRQVEAFKNRHVDPGGPSMACTLQLAVEETDMLLDELEDRYCRPHAQH